MEANNATDAPDEPQSEYVRLVCRRTEFRPVETMNARWLDPQEDYELARVAWSSGMELSREEWLGFWEQGYEYCGVVDHGLLLAHAAVWRYTDDAWELAAVGTLHEYRRQGLGKAVCSFATSRIIDANRFATCNIESVNVAMRRTATAIGFRVRLIRRTLRRSPSAPRGTQTVPDCAASAPQDATNHYL